MSAPLETPNEGEFLALLDQWFEIERLARLFSAEGWSVGLHDEGGEFGRSADASNEVETILQTHSRYLRSMLARRRNEGER
jgi:hypothetical protein